MLRNPFESPEAVDRNSRLSNSLTLRSALAYSIWGTGTFLISLHVLVDLLIGQKIPGGWVYFTLVFGPILGIFGAIATHHGTRAKFLLIIATLCLLPVQIMVIGTMLLATTGLEGTQ